MSQGFYREILANSKKFEALIQSAKDGKLHRLSPRTAMDLAIVLQREETTHTEGAEALSNLSHEEKNNLLNFVASEIQRMGIGRPGVDILASFQSNTKH